MKKYGLIGRPLSHSFSAGYFKKKFAELNITSEYKNYELEHIDDVKQLFELGLDGFNVTIPYKIDILDYLDGLSPDAAAMGAVNCVKRENDKYIGYNADWIGFRDSLLELIGSSLLPALVLGYGGASKAVIYCLEHLNIPYQIISRKEGHMTYQQLNEQTMDRYKIIINTTPLGMHPEVNTFPSIPYKNLNNTHYLYDLVYNPSMTVFLQRGQHQGAKIKNGMDMLILQAEKSWAIWNETI
jgi:shikimate dehydrogenase